MLGIGIMKKVIGCALLTLFIVGCDGGSSKTDGAALSSGISKLEHKQKNNQAKFDHAYKHLKTINQQFPKLNNKLQSQITSLSKNTTAQLKKVHSNLDSHFKSFHNEINEFGKQLAKAGY